MRCTRCGHETHNRQVDMTSFGVGEPPKIVPHFYCQRCETYAYQSLEPEPAENEGPPITRKMAAKLCEYCSNPEVGEYEGLNFVEIRVGKSFNSLFREGTRFLMHRECVGYIFNKIPAVDPKNLPDKWFTPRRPYLP